MNKVKYLNSTLQKRFPYSMNSLKIPINVKKFVIYGHTIGDEGAIEIANSLKSAYCKLEELNISDNFIKKDGACAIAKALRSCKLKELNISSNFIGNEGASALANALQSNSLQSNSLQNNTLQSNVRILHIRWNEIGDEGAIAIANALKRVDCRLKVLDIGCNNITHIGASAIADSLNSLKELDISQNIIGNEGAIAIANAIRSNIACCTLQVLDISRNNIGERGVIAIANSLYGNSLQKLNICDNYMGAISEFVNVLQRVFTLQYLYYCENEDINNLLERNKLLRKQVQNEFYTFILCWKSSRKDDIYPLNTIPKDVVFPLMCEYLSS